MKLPFIFGHLSLKINSYLLLERSPGLDWEAEHLRLHVFHRQLDVGQVLLDVRIYEAR
jgi:hypothetical protein